MIEHEQIENTLLEKEIMMELTHPFLVSMDYVFQSETRLYFIMPFIRGGELYQIFLENKRFEEDVVRFFAAQIILAIGELHKNGFMHRDLKLENVMMEEDGYLKVIDYGLAKNFSPGSDFATSFCGTPDYIAPEMIEGKGHDFSVDWWAVGVMIYEMRIGVTPF